jgi:hypothetical protein
LTKAVLNFDPPGLCDRRVRWAVERLNQRKRKLGTLGIG